MIEAHEYFWNSDRGYWISTDTGVFCGCCRYLCAVNVSKKKKKEREIAYRKALEKDRKQEHQEKVSKS